MGWELSYLRVGNLVVLELVGSLRCGDNVKEIPQLLFLQILLRQVLEIAF